MSWRTYTGVFFALLVAALAVNSVVLAKLPGLTPIDGFTYADATFRAMDGRMVVEGDTIGEATRREVRINGQYGRAEFQGFYPPLEEGGPPVTTTGYVHPPTYFFLTAASVRVIQALLPDAQTIAAARVANSWWFALGGLLLVAAAVQFGARPWPAVAVLLAMAPTPTFVSFFSFVTPDASMLVVSGALALAVASWWRGRLPSAVLAVAGLLAGLTKQTLLLAPLAGAALILVLWWTRRDTALRRSLTAVGALLGGAAVSVVGWQAVRESLGTDLPPFGPDPFAVPTTIGGVLSIVMRGFTEFPGTFAGSVPPLPLGLAGPAAALSAALAAAAGGALLYREPRDPLWSVGFVGALSVALGGLIVSGLYLWVSGIFLPPAPRYIAGAIPFYMIPLLVVARRRAVWVTALVIAGAGAVSWAGFAAT